jgi:hypothetical protein
MLNISSFLYKSGLSASSIRIKRCTHHVTHNDLRLDWTVNSDMVTLKLSLLWHKANGGWWMLWTLICFGDLHLTVRIGNCLLIEVPIKEWSIVAFATIKLVSTHVSAIDKSTQMAGILYSWVEKADRLRLGWWAPGTAPTSSSSLRFRCRLLAMMSLFRV